VPDIGRLPLQRVWLLDLGLTAVFLVGFTTWGMAIARLPSDYDEVYHAHAIWLIAQGDRPYHDFLGVHTPFLWYAASPLLQWMPDSPRMLFPLRIWAGVGILVWLAALISNIACNKSNISLRWMLAGLGVVLFSTPVLAYAVEFRPDAWAFALFYGALFLLRRQGTASASFARYAFFAFLATGATVACLKVAPFAAVFAVFDLLRLIRGGSKLRAAFLGQVTGVGVGLAMAWLFLDWMQIDVNLMFQFTYQFQVMFENNTGFSHGLLRSLIANPLPLAVASAGLVSWGAHTIRTRKAPDPFHASVIVVLVWELFQVHRPYKQYYGPWLLTAAPFIAYLEPFYRLGGRRDCWRLVTVLVVGCGVAAASFARIRQNELGFLIQRLQERIAASSDERSPIIAAPPFHPIVRRDVFYAWSRTTDPRGYTTERAMSDLGYGDLVSVEHDRDDLGRRDPAVIVLPLPGEDLYEPLQWQIISEFLRRHAESYDVVTEGYIRPFAVKRTMVETH
jgi:hypothetical protein